MQSPVHVAILETPAGFELNSPQVAGRIGEFLRAHLENHRPKVTIVPARKRDTPYSPEDPEIAGLISRADVVFMGPGSPTYAVRQLWDSRTWLTTVACHRLGASVVLASAAAIAASAYVLPVYEIYKVGEDLHWRKGLDFFGSYGLSLAVVPHWNNQDGGADVDTSRCYMGRARFDILLELLPSTVTVIGIDEHTALAIDLAAEMCHVQGRSGVTVLRAGEELRFKRRQTFSIYELGPFEQPQPQASLPDEVWACVAGARAQTQMTRNPPLEVLSLVEKRENARADRDWATADALRERIADLGWDVMDTQQGPQLESR
jgi:hypothetical protein